MRGRPGGKADAGDAVQRKQFHTAKQLHKALKKAQQFLIRKLLQRIKALSDEGTEPAPAAAKLQAQLQAAKCADLTALTQQALQLCGLVTANGASQRLAAPSCGAESKPTADTSAAAPRLISPAAKAADAVGVRLLTAGCVKAALVAVRGDREQVLQRAAQRESRKRRRERAAADREAAVHPSPAAASESGGAPSREQADRDASSSDLGSSADSGEEDERAAKRRRLLGHAPPADAGGRSRPPGKAAQKKKNRLGQRARRMASAGALAGAAGPQRAAAAGGSGGKHMPGADGSAPARPAPVGHAHGKRRPSAAEDLPARPGPAAKRDQGRGATLSQQASGSGTAAALHPSWVAKKQQAALPQAQGKKTVFDD